MKTEFLSSIDDWITLCQPYFEHEEVYFQLMITNANALMTQTDDQAFFGLVRDQDEIYTIFIYRPPYNLVVHPLRSMSNHEIGLFTEAIYKKDPSIPGINAPDQFAHAFSETFKSLSGRGYQLHLSMDIMEIRKLKPVKLPLVSCRLAQENDLPILDQWTCAFQEEALHESPDPVIIHQKSVERVSKKQCYLIIDEEHIPRAMGLLTRPMKKGIAITLVYTEPKSRGMGYGMSVAYHLSKIAFDMGYEYVTLYVDRSNPISNRVYKNVGFHVVIDQSDYRFRETY